jgi:putative mRNA 3-end processing factor
MSRSSVLTFTDKGIYCPAGDFYLDPWRPVDRAVISHAHSDHARYGHRHYLATPQSAPVMRHRMGNIALDTLPYGKTQQIGDATVSLHPAGHVPGSAQIRVEVDGEVWVFSGDYKPEPDGFCEAFEPQRCHAFISECTFGLPVFNWQPQQMVMDEINSWWATNRAEGRFSLLAAYSFGKAQRLLAQVDPSIGPILTHGAVEATNAVLRQIGYHLPDTIQVTADLDPSAYKGALVIAPPSAIGAAWAKRFKPAQTAMASGWMRLRGIRRRRAMDRGFALSDHADWQGLNDSIRATGAERIFVTHGYTDVFSRWLTEQGYEASIVSTEYSDDSLEQAEVAE